MRLLSLIIALGCWSASAQDTPSLEILKQVDPDWGTLTSGFIVEQRQVELGVDANGEPSSLSTKTSVPDPIVRSFAQWRFKTGDFTVPLQVDVRVPLTPDLERAQSTTWEPAGDVLAAIIKADELNPAKAASLISNLANATEPGNARISLLTYHARKGPADPDSARKARRDLILWFVRNDPQNQILSSPYALVNASGEPLADLEGAALIKQEWLKALKQHPNDDAVVQNAANFLRLSDPNAALRVVLTHHWDKQTRWIGSIAAAGALGVTAFAPDTGTPLAASPIDSTASYRKALLDSRDLKVVLSGMATISNLARDLATRNAVPSDFPDYCAALLKHTRDLYPQTSLTCDATPRPAPGVPTAGRVVEGNLVKRVNPAYPKKAKSKHIQGTVEFIATIGADGRLEQLELVKAPLVFYDSARSAVMQWQYRPTLINGQSVSVITDILIDFNLSQ